MDYSYKNMGEGGFSIRRTRALVIVPIAVGIFCSLFFCAMIVLMTVFQNDTVDLGLLLVFVAFGILSMSLIFIGFIQKRWEIRIEGVQITYIPLFGDAKQFTFDEISRVQSVPFPGLHPSIAEIRFYVGDKKVFAVPSTCRGFQTLLICLNEKRISFS